MTALNCFVAPDAVHLFSDGALYEGPPAAKIAGFAAKVLPLPQFDAVVGVTGKYWATLMVAAALSESRCTSYDAMVDGFSEFIRRYVTHSAAIPGAPSSWGPFEIVLAGWSESSGKPNARLLTSYQREHPAWHFRPITRFQMPMVSPTFEFDRSDPAASGLKLVQEQRSRKMPIEQGTGPASLNTPQVYGVGGFVQHTIVSSEGVQIKVLKRWPEDEIGERINPFADRRTLEQ